MVLSPITLNVNNSVVCTSVPETCSFSRGPDLCEAPCNHTITKMLDKHRRRDPVPDVLTCLHLPFPSPLRLRRTVYILRMRLRLRCLPAMQVTHVQVRDQLPTWVVVLKTLTCRVLFVCLLVVIILMGRLVLPQIMRILIRIETWLPHTHKNKLARHFVCNVQRKPPKL